MTRIFSVSFLSLWALLFCSSEVSGLSLTASLVKGRVYYKTAKTNIYQISRGQIVADYGDSLLTFTDGQCFFYLEDSTEFRLKEESIFAFVSSDTFELRKGTFGIKLASHPVLLRTPHLFVELDNALAVIKVNPVLTRLCIVRGSASVYHIHDKTRVTVPENTEIAAAPGRLSKIYPRTDELRFAWYWVAPDKEPSLQ
ncbi:MAG: hypothetical protein EOM80_00190 [Erysipelotrichia bacterium]|nr:hypothetical protein [Erysipelotrichia bacterium]